MYVYYSQFVIIIRREFKFPKKKLNQYLIVF